MYTYRIIKENMVNGTQTATVTLSQRRYITKIRKLAEKYPEECQIIAENRDGSLCAHVPVSWIKIAPPRVLNENQLNAVRRNLSKSQSIRYGK